MSPSTSIWTIFTHALRGIGMLVILAALAKKADLLPKLPGADFLTLLNSFITALVAWLASIGTSKAAETASGGLRDETVQRTRDKLRDRVEATWLGELREDSLHSSEPIELNIENYPSAIEQEPWTVQKLPEQSNQPLSLRQRIIDIFDAAKGSLLILGEPGSGKTTALLELTRELIDRAKEDKKFPTPVVLNLSRWSEKRLSMDEWLIEELSFEYRYHQMTTTPWVHGQQILLLLDGLNEVRYEYRALCIDAINHFLEKYNAVDIVVCCRTDDYDDLDTQLGFAPFSRTVCL